MSSGEVARLFVALALSVAVLDLLLTGGLGLFFDLALVCLCVGAGLTLRPDALVTAGLLSPCTVLGVVVLVAVADPAAVADPRDGVVQATVTGLSRHAIALALGYGACLGLLWWRREQRPQ